MAAEEGVRVTGKIVTTDTTDTYPTHDAKLGLGGLREAVDHTERNAISSDRRRQGMIVYTQNDAEYWSLKAGPWNGTDSDWELTLGSGDVGVISVESGGTGATTARAARINLGAITGLIVLIPGDGVETEFVLTHNMNFGLTMAQVTDVNTGQQVDPDVAITNNNAITVTFGHAPGANELNAVIIGLEI
jgi:hypothetical protein